MNLNMFYNKIKKNRFILILGMHRSGTSCLAGMLKERGLFLGDVNNNNKFNLKGNQESPIVNKINIDLMYHNNISWKSPGELNNIPLSIYFRILFYKMNNSRSLWGIKDPRLLFCLEAWKTQGTDLIGTFRNPGSVIASLLQRMEKNGKKKPAWIFEEQWFQYNRRLLMYYQQNPFPIVNFDWDRKRFQTAVDRISNFFSLKKESNRFYDETLIHQKKANDSISLKNQILYDELCRISLIEEKKYL